MVAAPWTPALVSPLMTKLYQESNLRVAPNAIALHPEDARDCGARAILQTRLGKCAVNVVADPARSARRGPHRIVGRHPRHLHRG